LCLQSSSSFLVSGSRDATDSFGDGVMRQVIYTALQKCLAWTSDAADANQDMPLPIAGDACTALDDDFLSLKLSRFPSTEKLAVVFAIGRLCALHLLKVCNAPHPITPALLSLIVNGTTCLTAGQDHMNSSTWLHVSSPALAQILSSLPTENGSASDLPTDPVNRLHITRICQSRLDTSVSLIELS
jgi:hypothetical protein